MLSNACPKLKDGKTQRDERAEKVSSKEKHRRQVYAIVDRRDGQECRVCERRCSTTMLDRLLRAERDHIIPRSLGGLDETWNLATVCGTCHDDKHKRGTLRLTGNADERNEMGQLAGIKVERLTESGWKFEAFV